MFGSRDRSKQLRRKVMDLLKKSHPNDKGWAGWVSLPYEDLSGADLSGLNLSFGPTDFTRADLSGACLDNANLNGVCFENANLSHVRARDACFNGADLTGVNFTGADLREAQMNAADFSGAILEDVDFTDAEVCAPKGEPPARIHNCIMDDVIFKRLTYRFRLV